MKIIKTIAKVLLAVCAVLGAMLFPFLMFLKFSPTVGRTPDEEDEEKLKKSDHYNGRKFINEHEISTMSGENRTPSGSMVHPAAKLPVIRHSMIERAEEGELHFYWLGHSSMLLQAGRKNILIDPVFAKHASPVPFAGPKRFSELPIEPELLPDIDVLFISHDHYDHLDQAGILKLDMKVGKYVVPLGLNSFLEGWGIDESRIVTLDWWESTRIDGLDLTLVPSQHFSGRNPLRSNATLWGGIYISDDAHSFYYTGDGGYNDVFLRVREKLGAPDLMTADSGQYNAAWKDVHMNAAQSVRAAKDAGAGWFIPVHWGAYVLSNHDWNEPAIMAKQAGCETGVRVCVPKIGEEVRFDEIEKIEDEWWV